MFDPTKSYEELQREHFEKHCFTTGETTVYWDREDIDYMKSLSEEDLKAVLAKHFEENKDRVISSTIPYDKEGE